MSEALRKIFQNPFLKESPFRSNQNFYSTPLNYLHQSAYRPQSRNNYVDLSISYGKQNNVNSTNQRKIGERAYKKIQNPFFRKNLINSNKYEQNFGQIQSTSYLDISSKIKTSNFFHENVERKYENNNQNNYRDLSYNSGTQWKRQTLCHDQKINGSNKDISNGANYTNLNLISKKYLSPRFPSINAIQVRQNNIYGLSLQSPSIACSPRGDKVNFNEGISKQVFSSQRKINQNENEPERDTYDRIKQLSKEIKLPNDGNPKEILVRGEKYYRNFVQIR